MARKPKKSAQKLNREERIGRHQIAVAIGGRESTGRKLSKEDRQKLLKAAGENIMEGRRKRQTSDSNNK